MTDLPTVRVIRGTPDEVELAALVAGLVAATSVADGLEQPLTHPAWGDHARMLPAARTTWRTGPDTWRWSGR